MLHGDIHTTQEKNHCKGVKILPVWGHLSEHKCEAESNLDHLCPLLAYPTACSSWLVRSQTLALLNIPFLLYITHQSLKSISSPIILQNSTHKFTFIFDGRSKWLKFLTFNVVFKGLYKKNQESFFFVQIWRKTKELYNNWSSTDFKIQEFFHVRWKEKTKHPQTFKAEVSIYQWIWGYLQIPRETQKIYE